MIFKLTSHLLNNLGYIIALSFFFTKFERARNIFTRERRTKKDIFWLSIFFSGLAILGTYVGIDYKGSLVNTRNIGVVVGGIIAGPEIGIIAGIVAGIHRYLIDPAGVTSIPCAIATIFGGFFTAFLYKRSNAKNSYIYGFIGGFVVENLSMALIMILGSDFYLAKEIVSHIYFPMILANAIGVSVVILIVDDIISEKEILAGKQAKLSLDIANKTLPYFRKGESLNEVCKIIAQSLDAKTVIITNDTSIIASFSQSEDFKVDHTKIRSQATKRVLKTGQILTLGRDSNLDFDCINGNVQSCIICPIFQGEKAIFGALKLYFDKKLSETSKNEPLAEGLSLLISTQLEIGRIKDFKAMARDAELKALQAQINPHFLFNALHTTAALVRLDPTKARKVIIDLATYLRFNLENTNQMVPLAKELEQVQAYVSIEEARFPNKVSVVYEIEEGLENIDIPSLTIQPLVENSIKHGILPKRTGGTVKIIARPEKEGCIITIEDDGVGIPPKVVEELDSALEKNIGLKNVHQRLKLMYGKGLEIVPVEVGTKISFFIK